MPCVNPRMMWPPVGGGRYVNSPTKSYSGAVPVSVPCGKCRFCRVARAREWQGRLIAEMKLHEECCFITVTYNDDHLPANRSLVPDDLKLFMKRLRKAIFAATGKKIRFFACGEYGDKGRAHYHILVFGWEPENSDSERYDVRQNRKNNLIYKSRTVDKTWGKGYADIGTVTPESCGYVARYCVKMQASQAYDFTDPKTGEVFTNRLPPFTRASNRPGIGADWYDQFKGDLSDGRFMPDPGRTFGVPKYFKEKLKKDNPKGLLKLRVKSMKFLRDHAHDNTAERVADRLEVLELRLKRLPRQLDEMSDEEFAAFQEGDEIA